MCISGLGQAPSKSIVRCHYLQTDNGIELQVSLIFFDDRLALIEVEPPYDSYSCFEEPEPTVPCHQYSLVMHDLAANLGPTKSLISTKEAMKKFPAQGWESDAAIAQFQVHMCGAWRQGAGWSPVVLELLDQSYCGDGDSVSYRQPVMFYVDKKLGRKLADSLAAE